MNSDTCQIWDKNSSLKRKAECKRYEFKIFHLYVLVAFLRTISPLSEKKTKPHMHSLHSHPALKNTPLELPLADKEKKIHLIRAPLGHFTGRDSGYGGKKFALLLPAQGQTWDRGLEGQKDSWSTLSLLYARFFPGTWLIETNGKSHSEEAAKKKKKEPQMPCVSPK